MFAVYIIAGCTSHKTLTLMPTSVLYQNAGIDLFAHLSPELKSTKRFRTSAIMCDYQPSELMWYPKGIAKIFID